VLKVSDVYAAVPSITGKLELEYEGELQGGEVIAKELIRQAAGETLRARAGGYDFEAVVGWFDAGGALQVSPDERTEVCLKGFGVVPGLVEAATETGLAAREERGQLVAACELILEGLVAQKRISRSEELGYTRARPERREPGHSKGFQF
jgi:magnesium chelatase subunit I